ncbi:electron transfer flavoprotein subunit alpha/FixB family protein [SAR202 cluster bacterium AC-647-N09_OGT_505m]|nr:electron transfer flavoprotein subunit alpha/FixB family protein [SAR202 cluster bacterium AC-647-N09_OGT_505m]
MVEGQGVLIVGELADGGIAGVTGELLGVGRKLADALGEELSAVFLGSDVGDTAKGAFAQGADKVYVADAPIFKGYQPESAAAILDKLCRETSPNVVILAVTYMGRDLAPRLAHRLETGLAMDCTDLSIESGTKTLIATRPVFGGKALAEVDCGAVRPAMASVRAKSQEPLTPDPSRQGEVVQITVDLDPAIAKTNVVDMMLVEAEGVKLEDARIVVGGGRGIGSVDNWKALVELAEDLKGAVGSTRGACDEGYCAMDTQLGITSKNVAPELYLAVGISGASQHMSGVSFSKHIACINRDADAPIFKGSELGVVGKWEDVLPAFHKKVKELMAE